MASAIRSEQAISLVELVVAMSVLGVVMGAFVILFVGSGRLQVDLEQRFQAQAHARLALDKLRTEVHCASSVTSLSPSSLTLALPAQCSTGSGAVTWCALGGGTRWTLTRFPGSTCGGSGASWADYLTRSSLFSYVPPTSSSLAKLHVDLPVNLQPSRSRQQYQLSDDIVLRNSLRA